MKPNHLKYFLRSRSYSLNPFVLDPTIRPVQINPANLEKYKYYIQNYKPKTKSWKYKLNPPKEAAVLLPLCTVDGIASILFTVRSSKLRTHTGEVSFPGGNTDPEDENPTVTALRETHEEILIHPTNVNVLGPFISLPNKSLSTKVTAVIGDLGIISPSLLKFNTDEVESIFTVPIDQLLKTGDMESFRDSSWVIPSWNIDGHRIWGLTGFILGEFLKSVIVPATNET